MSRARKACTLLLTVTLCLPLAYAILTDHRPPWLPWRIHEFWRIHELFTRPARQWPRHEVLIETTGGQTRPASPDPVFRHRLYGVMTRLDRLLLVLDAVQAPAIPERDRIYERLGQAYAKHYPDATAVRFRRSWRTSRREAAAIRPWSQPLPDALWDDLYTYRIGEAP